MPGLGAVPWLLDRCVLYNRRWPNLHPPLSIVLLGSSLFASQYSDLVPYKTPTQCKQCIGSTCQIPTLGIDTNQHWPNPKVLRPHRHNIWSLRMFWVLKPSSQPSISKTIRYKHTPNVLEQNDFVFICFCQLCCPSNMMLSNFQLASSSELSLGAVAFPCSIQGGFLALSHQFSTPHACGIQEQ